MKKIQFTSPLSAIAVKAALNEVSGSVFQDCYFIGWVDKSSFRLKWQPFKTGRYNHAMPVLMGKFCKKEQETQITIEAKFSMSFIISLIALILMFVVTLIFLFVKIVRTNLINAFAAIIAVLFLFLVILCINLVIYNIKVKLSISKIKKVLKATNN